MAHELRCARTNTKTLNLPSHSCNIMYYYPSNIINGDRYRLHWPPTSNPFVSSYITCCIEHRTLSIVQRAPTIAHFNTASFRPFTVGGKKGYINWKQQKVLSIKYDEVLNINRIVGGPLLFRVSHTHARAHGRTHTHAHHFMSSPRSIYIPPTFYRNNIFRSFPIAF